MPRYSISQLIARANAGNIGYRGLRRLQNAGLNPDELAPSGVQSPLQHNPQEDLEARRAALYARAVQQARTTNAPLSAGIQRRLALGAPGGDAGDLTVQGIRGMDEASFSTVLDELRKRRTGLRSSAGIYQGLG